MEVIYIHIDIKLTTDNDEIVLPIHYNYIVQSAIYNSISDELADFLHNTGYSTEKRTFKLFSFSQLNGSFRLYRKDGKIKFYSPINLTISSPIDEFCETLVNTLLTKGYMQFLNYDLSIEHINLRRVRAGKNEVRIKTLSPIVVYSTLLKADGNKYTCYFQPGEPKFEELILGNLLRKYKALYKDDFIVDYFNIHPISKIKMHIIKYKSIVIKAYSGCMKVSAPKELIHLMLDCGLGGKNSQGFGCIDIL